jgi:ABC-type transport system substrate-binding protein
MTKLPSPTIKLRHGVKFHGGADLTADDVVASQQCYRQSAGTSAVLKSRKERPGV